MFRPDHESTVSEKLIDQLQVAIPLAQRVQVMAKQTAADATRMLTALEHASAILTTSARMERDRQQASARLVQESGGAK